MEKYERKLEELLSKEDGTKKLLEEILILLQEKKKFIIFGAGIGGSVLFQYMKKQNLRDKLIGFSDNNVLKVGMYYYDYPILSPNTLYDQYPNCDIIIASSAYQQIYKQLLEQGYNCSQIHLYNLAFSDLDYTDKEFIWDHIDEFSWAYDKMKDKKSKMIFLLLLNYKITKDNSYLVELCEYSDDEYWQYFDKDLVSILSTEIFADIGAYVGDTLQRFIEESNNCYSKYIAIEAEKETYQILLNTIAKNNWKNIDTYNIGVWNKKAYLCYNNENTFGNFSVSETVEKTQNQLANTLYEILGDIPITFMKMDIEGAEYNALLGAEYLIKKYHPIIAICVYHKRDDYYKLLMTIDKFLPGEYSFYFRQYRYTPTETVCYAIPKHRMKKGVDTL